jgi:hypothetical protein
MLPRPAAATVGRVAAAYDAALVRRPTLVKTATAVAVAVVGDVVCQKLQARAFAVESRKARAAADDDADADAPPRLDLPRTARMTAWTAFITPAVASWYVLLARTFPGSPLARVAADQLLWAPAGTAGFFTAVEGMRTGSLRAGFAVALERTPPTLAANWVVWPVAQFVNFTFVPARYTVLFTNVISLGWNGFISLQANPSTVPTKGEGEARARRHVAGPAALPPGAPPPGDLDGATHAAGTFGSRPGPPHDRRVPRHTDVDAAAVPPHATRWTALTSPVHGAAPPVPPPLGHPDPAGAGRGGR